MQLHKDGARFDIVIFGGGGDLSLRKLLPALLQLIVDGHTAQLGRIICSGRQDISSADFRAQVALHLRKYWRELDAAALDDFLRRIEFIAVDAADGPSYENFSTRIADFNQTPKLFYLATPPELFGSICQHLAERALIAAGSRVVLEKPIGSDLASCRAINEKVAQAFPEEAIFRIDHYLGKEAVQNLLALRFGNTLLTPIWNNQYISNVQITVAESVGVEGRISYYTKAGAFKDMVQNHLLQLLCLVAMEPPYSLQAHAVRDEKVKVLRALKPFDASSAAAHSVRGQYQSGVVDGNIVSAYIDEIGGSAYRDAETFVALRVGIDNWRWAGVPFYLRTGKRMAKRVSQIVIEFKPQPFSIFQDARSAQQCNRLLIRLQPEENITLWMMNKRPGLASAMTLQPVALDLMSRQLSANSASYDAYVRLLLDVINGDQALFMRRDEVEAAWNWADGVTAAWRELDAQPLPYLAGSMGPDAAVNLIGRDGLAWFGY